MFIFCCFGLRIKGMKQTFASMLVFFWLVYRALLVTMSQTFRFNCEEAGAKLPMRQALLIHSLRPITNMYTPYVFHHHGMVDFFFKALTAVFQIQGHFEKVQLNKRQLKLKRLIQTNLLHQDRMQVV